jgi:hypothetical protein
MDRRSSANRERESIPFVDHHPEAVVEGLAGRGPDRRTGGSETGLRP